MADPKVPVKKAAPLAAPKRYHLELSDRDLRGTKGLTAVSMSITERTYEATETMHALVVAITGPLVDIKERQRVLLEMINAAQDIYQRNLNQFDGGLTQKSPTLDVQQKFKKP